MLTCWLACDDRFARFILAQELLKSCHDDFRTGCGVTRVDLEIFRDSERSD